MRKGLIGLLAAFVLMATTSIAHAAFPGLNGKIAFDSHTTSDDIYVVEPDGSGRTAITGPPDSERGPQWSPDGTKMVLDIGGDIFVMNADGTGRVNLTPGGVGQDQGAVVVGRRDPDRVRQLAHRGGLQDLQDERHRWQQRDSGHHRQFQFRRAAELVALRRADRIHPQPAHLDRSFRRHRSHPGYAGWGSRPPAGLGAERRPDRLHRPARRWPAVERDPHDRARRLERPGPWQRLHRQHERSGMVAGRLADRLEERTQGYGG